MASLTQYKYVLAVAKYGNFVVAARNIHVTQPTLSMQIKKLEEELGIIIFDRQKHPIVPTPLGKLIVEQARAVVSEAEKVKEIVEEYKGDVSGQLNIGVIPTLAPYLLHRFIGKFVKKYPKVKVNIQEMLSEEILEGLKNYQLHLGILSTPVHEKGIEELPVFYEKIYCYVHPEHPFASVNDLKTHSLNDPNANLWLLTHGHCFRSQVVNLCNLDEDYNGKSNIRYESGSLESLFRIVEKEGGITLFPELALENLRKNGSVIHEFADMTPVREIGLVYSKNFTRYNVINAIKKSIEENLPPQMLDPKRGTIIEWR